jgi:hypothetical protein
MQLTIRELQTRTRRQRLEIGRVKRDFIPQNTRDGAEVSLRQPTASQEPGGMKKRRLAPFEMTVGWWHRRSLKRGRAGTSERPGTKP